MEILCPSVLFSRTTVVVLRPTVSVYVCAPALAVQFFLLAAARAVTV
jgi:hypothetical protein